MSSQWQDGFLVGCVAAAATGLAVALLHRSSRAGPEEKQLEKQYTGAAAEDKLNRRARRLARREELRKSAKVAVESSANDSSSRVASVEISSTVAERDDAAFDSVGSADRILRKAETVLQRRTTRIVIVVEKCSLDHNHSVSTMQMGFIFNTPYNVSLVYRVSCPSVNRCVLTFDGMLTCAMHPHVSRHGVCALDSDWSIGACTPQAIIRTAEALGIQHLWLIDPPSAAAAAAAATAGPPQKKYAKKARQKAWEASDTPRNMLTSLTNDAVSSMLVVVGSACS